MKKFSSKRAALIAEVREYAQANYGRGAWDVIVECYTDTEISMVIGRARTLKGAVARFGPIVSVLADRRADAENEILAAVGTPSGDPNGHYLLSSREYVSEVGDFPCCACGQEFPTVKAADLHVIAMMQAAGTYDRQAAGHHPDGSFVAWRHDEHSGEAWAYRTWDGKVGKAFISIEQDDEGEYVTMEAYRPGWRGAAFQSLDYCDHRPGAVNGWCDGQWHSEAHAHEGCTPPF